MNGKFTPIWEVITALCDTWPNKDIELVIRRDGSSTIVDKEEYPEFVGGVTQRFENLDELMEFLDL